MTGGGGGGRRRRFRDPRIDISMDNRSMLPLLRMLEVGHGEVLLTWRNVFTCIYKEHRAITEALT